MLLLWLRVAAGGCFALFSSIAPLLAQNAEGRAAGDRASEHDSAPVVRVARRSGAVKIDGRPDESAWAAASPVTEFVQYDPQEGQPATERTEVRFLIGDDALYIGARLFDSEPAGIRSRLARRDEAAESDLFEVWIDSEHEHLTAFRFRLNPAGAMRDATVLRRGEDESWDPIWQGAAQVDSLGWSAEMRIPLSQLRYSSGENAVFGVMLGRVILRKQETTFFPFTPKSERLGPHRYAHLQGLGRLATPRRLELLPYARARADYRTVAAGNPFHDGSAWDATGGFDLKYGITSGLTLDATVNPDFGQVEVDPAIVNLSAFETFFEERRPFFVEGADLFRFGQTRTQNSSFGSNLFHSRRIGRAPQRRLSEHEHPFADVPEETTIAAAGKLSGRVGSWSVGMMEGLTPAENARYLAASGREAEVGVEPLTNYFLGRIARNLRGGSTTIGGIATAVNRDLGDPVLRALLRSDAYVAGIDWQHAWHNRRWALDGFVVASRVQGSPAAIEATQRSSARYYHRPDADHLDYDATRTVLTGTAAELSFLKLAGEHWTGGVTYQHTSPGYEVNDLGFQGRADVRSVSGYVVYSENRPGTVLRNYGLMLFSNESWNYGGDLIQGGIGLIGAGRLLNFTNFFVRFDWSPDLKDDRLTRGGPLGVDPGNWFGMTEISSDARKPISVRGEGGSIFGARSGNRYRFLNATITYRPAPSLRLSVTPAWSGSSEFAQFVTTVPDSLATATYGRRYVLATIEQTELSFNTRLDWTFTPRLSLQLFTQPLVATGRYSDHKEFATPGEYEFAVYGHDRGTVTAAAGGGFMIDPDASGPAPSFFVPALDFNFRSLRGNAVLRWEYRPGSTLYLVWQQRRSHEAPFGDFDFSRDYGGLLNIKPENVFVAKVTYWLGS